MSDSKIDAAYNQQLEHWIKQTGRQKLDIANLASCFRFDELEIVNVDRSTLSRLIQKRPSYYSAMYKLYALLGVFYTLDVLTESEIKKFLNDHNLVKRQPANLTWDNIWSSIENGKQEINARSGVNEIVPLKQKHDGEISSAKQPTRPMVVGFFTFVLLIAAIFTVLVNLSGQRNQSICNEPVASNTPDLLNEQGFSLYTPNVSNLDNGIAHPHIRSVGFDSLGLWVGYVPQNNGFDGVSHFDRETKQWQHCIEMGLEANQSINDIEAFEGSVYFATDGGGVKVFVQDADTGISSWTSYTTEHGLPNNSVYDLFVHESELYATTFEGVVKLSGQYWRLIYDTNNSGLTDNHIHNIYFDNAGNRWFGHIGRGISRLAPDGQWRNYYAGVSDARAIRGIVADTQGGIWFATDGNGVLRFFNEQWSEFTHESGFLPDNGAQDVEVDKFDRIWVATTSGVVYTPDYGKTWMTHSHMNTWGLEFGCEGCLYDQDHLWLIIRDVGLGHVRVPPQAPTIRVENVSTGIVLSRGEEFVFNVTVRVLGENLADGDGLFSNQPIDSPMYGAYPRIPITGEIEQGGTYTFSNVDNPIIAPEELGIYQLIWRVWQNGRFVTEPIVIEFEVVE